MTGTIRIKPLALAIAVPLAGGYVSALLSGDIKAVYEAITLPDFAPAEGVFSLVWPILYIMMGIASYMIWETPSSPARTQALTFYAVQLALNFLWTPLFFRFGMFHFSFWMLCAILVLAIITTACFAMLNKWTLWLMLPYVLWLVYAASLNRAVAALN